MDSKAWNDNCLSQKRILTLTKLALLKQGLQRNSRSSAICFNGLSWWFRCTPSLRATGVQAAYPCVTQRSAQVLDSHIPLHTNHRSQIPSARFIITSSNSLFLLLSVSWSLYVDCDGCSCVYIVLTQTRNWIHFS